MTCPEMTERTIYHIWQDVAFNKHLADIQVRLSKAHAMLIARLRSRSFAVRHEGNPCLFYWLDVSQFEGQFDEKTGHTSRHLAEVDTAELALQAHKDGWLVAPGYLFSPSSDKANRWKTHIRLNVTTTTDEFLDWLVGWLVGR